jgi:hypothetical protein
MRTFGARARTAFLSLMIFAVLAVSSMASAQDSPARSGATSGDADSKKVPASAKDSPREGGAKNNFRDFGRQLINPWTIALPAMTAGLTTAMADDKKGTGFEPGATGYGQRFGVYLADTGEAKFIRAFAMPTIFNQVERYRPLGSGHSFGSRFGNALAHTFVTKTRNGNNTFNMSGVPASFAVAGLGTLYYPGRYSDRWHTVQRAGWIQLGYFSLDEWREFRPEICRAIHIPCGKRESRP